MGQRLPHASFIIPICRARLLALLWAHCPLPPLGLASASRCACAACLKAALLLLLLPAPPQATFEGPAVTASAAARALPAPKPMVILVPPLPFLLPLAGLARDCPSAWLPCAARVELLVLLDVGRLGKASKAGITPSLLAPHISQAATSGAFTSVHRLQLQLARLSASAAMAAAASGGTQPGPALLAAGLARYSRCARRSSLRCSVPGQSAASSDTTGKRPRATMDEWYCSGESSPRMNSPLSALKRENWAPSPPSCVLILLMSALLAAFKRSLTELPPPCSALLPASPIPAPLQLPPFAEGDLGEPGSGAA